MSTPHAVLTAFHQRRITLALTEDGEALRYRAPQGTLTPTDMATLREHKEALLRLLDRFEEKAAILEYDEGYPRAEAERLAWEALGVVAPGTAEEAA